MLLKGMRTAFGTVCVLLLLGVVAPGPASSDGGPENVTLLGHRDAYSYHSGIWGYTAPNGTELAIIGTQNGTSFVNVTNPAAMTEVAFISGASSTWREIRTHGTYAYISTEASAGLQIVNMANPLLPALAATYTGAFDQCHSLNYDPQTGYLYCNGTRTNTLQSGLKILNLANPVAPTVEATYNGFYAHDCYVRNGICWVAAIQDGGLLTLDVSNLPTITQLDFTPYSGDATHNMWLTDDNRYLYTTDETGGGHIRVWDVLDPANPVQVTEWLNPEEPNSSVHNVIINGGFAYISWYTAGIQILDVRNPAAPERAGFYDTYPGSGGFDGNWGVFPFLASGNVCISDMSTGLYVFGFDSSYGTLQGTVRDSNTSAPISGVTVNVPSAGETTTTDVNGFYKVNLAPDTYDVDFSVFGYEDQSISVTITQGVTTTRDVSLVSLPRGTMTGIVSAAAGGAPLDGATVEILTTPLAATSAADGSYAINGIPIGSYQARASKFGYASRTYTVDILANQTTPRPYSLTASFFADNAETNQGWSLGVAGDNASAGIWIRANPNGTAEGTVQPEDDHTPAPGVTCFVTGNCTPGCGIGDNDVDGGTTTLQSPTFNLVGQTGATVRYWRWYTNNAGGSPNSDTWSVGVTSNGGATWINLESTLVTDASWSLKEFALSSYIALTNNVRFRFVASDLAAGSIVEAAVDDFELYVPVPATDSPEPGIVMATRLLANTPNPFTSETQLRFQLGTRQPVLLEILDVQGREVRRLVDGMLEPGPHSVIWNGRDAAGKEVPHGVYFQRLQTAGLRESEKVLVVR